ncbi:RNAse M5 [Caloranaerobacter azorensis DSM 13643]|uniref:Ribonuclease M5 n=1 Tax=Caloranaerobacter azorensis DSM 13643 TaxID=1121264 RepID=A0A1M5T5T7_9FIRM|nr:ribonuclease M5 [Caloranaerobacter azorensis]SHH46058.1 RNAse M5 [Caloranaerobacter azorensis DSM 13643]
MIKEVIVVEGKDDIAAVKRAVDAEIIATGGFGLSPETMKRIKTAAKKRGVIIFTDPDYAGEKIRKIISEEIKNCKHAFLPREKAVKGDNIGIENASKEDIIMALKNARVESIEERREFTKEDMIKYGLVGHPNSSKKREELGEILGIGYCNSKQFLKRLNNYGITREEFIEAIRRIEK